MLWKILGTAGPVLAANATRKAASSVWETIVGTTPPNNPEDPETEWLEAVAWAALIGAVVGVARMAATRQAARAHVKMTGKNPKALEKQWAKNRKKSSN